MDEHVTSFNSMTLGDQDARVNYSSTKQEIYREVVDGVLIILSIFFLHQRDNKYPEENRLLCGITETL